MNQPAKVLVIEDTASDYLLLCRQLRQHFPEFECRHVQGREEFEAALHEGGWDIVLSDYRVPGLPFDEALARLTAELDDVPVILVSGSIGEEQAVALLKRGLADFVLKDRLARLGTAVQRALDDADQRRAQRRAEEALRESESRYRLLFESVHDAVFVMRPLPGSLNSAIVEVNEVACRRLGYTRDEFRHLTTESISECIHTPRGRLEIERVVEFGGGLMRDRHRTKDGDWIPVELSCSPFLVGGQRYTIAVARDVSERLRAEEQRQELERRLLRSQRLEAVGRLAGGVAHDYNNMLAVILGYTEAALARLAPKDPLHQDLSEVLRAAKRSAELTRQLLTFSRRQEISPQTLDLAAAIKGMARLLRPVIGEDISLSVTSEDDLWMTFLDPAQVDQLVANLVVNARDAMPGGGQLSIHTANLSGDGDEPGEWVELTITDTGCGMSDEVREHIFEPFFTTKAEGVGTGLGLATVYGIVQQNGGQIAVDSELGHGTTVRLRFPRHLGAAPEAERPSSPAAPAAGGEVILLVEDESSVRRLATTILSRLGYQVLSAAGPDEALALFADQPERVALLLTDLVMPGLNGRELAATIHESRPGLPVVYMSGYSAEILADRQALADGAGFLQKPFTMDGLAAHVRAALDG